MTLGELLIEVTPHMKLLLTQGSYATNSAVLGTYAIYSLVPVPDVLLILSLGFLGRLEYGASCGYTVGALFSSLKPYISSTISESFFNNCISTGKFAQLFSIVTNFLFSSLTFTHCRPFIDEGASFILKSTSRLILYNPSAGMMMLLSLHMNLFVVTNLPSE